MDKFHKFIITFTLLLRYHYNLLTLNFDTSKLVHKYIVSPQEGELAFCTYALVVQKQRLLVIIILKNVIIL